MKKYNLDDFKLGWIIGNFEPSIVNTNLFEISIKKYSKGDYEQVHFHKTADEITVIITGKVLMNGVEYEANDILQVVKPILLNQFKVVLGSRSIKCSNINQRIRLRQIYGNDWLSYFLSKYGGILLSITTLLLYNRYVTDPLSTLKAFDKALLEDLNLKSSGLDLEMETIAKITLRGEYILEVPVQYKARSVMEGKKTTVVEGIKALFALFIWLKK